MNIYNLNNFICEEKIRHKKLQKLNHKAKQKITNKKAAIAFLFHHATHLQRAKKSEPQYARNCFIRH